MKKNWKQRILAAKRRKRFTEGDKDKACEWSTCAVSERMAQEGPVSLATRSVYDLKYEPLRQLGYDFMAAVLGQKIPEADRLYRTIRTWEAV